MTIHTSFVVGVLHLSTEPKEWLGTYKDPFEEDKDMVVKFCCFMVKEVVDAINMVYFVFHIEVLGSHGHII